MTTPFDQTLRSGQRRHRRYRPGRRQRPPAKSCAPSMPAPPASSSLTSTPPTMPSPLRARLITRPTVARGLAMSTRAGRHSTGTVAEHLERSRRQTVVIVQIEDQKVVAAARDIAATTNSTRYGSAPATCPCLSASRATSAIPK